MTPQGTHLQIQFSGGTSVDAVYHGFTIHTDQPKGHGGQGAAPAPFDLFLASIATCAGFYALRFCQERAIPTVGMSLRMEMEKDPEGQRIGLLRLVLGLPSEFPQKYQAAIVRAMDQCAVKRHILEPPKFDVVAVAAAAEPTLAASVSS